MFQIRDQINIVVGSALLSLLALVLSDALVRNSFGQPLASFFYYPHHAVTMIALLIGGSWAALGIILSSLLWNILFVPLNPLSYLDIIAGSWFSYSLTLWIKNALLFPNPYSEWQCPSLQNLIFYCIIFSANIVLFSQLILIHIPEIDPLSFENFLLMFFKTLFTCGTIFILLNLILSGYIAALKHLNAR